MSQTQLASVSRGNSLVLQILIGILAGGVLAYLSPELAGTAGLLGQLFVSALKAVAPILVFVLVAASIANQKQGQRLICALLLGFILLAPSRLH